MEIKILQVFLGVDGLPYKDQERTVHFPIVGSGFQGASNTTKIRFYYDELVEEDDTETAWVACAKLPNGKIGSKVLETDYDSTLGEHYALLELDSFYFQYKGDVYISLQGYQGGVQVDYDEKTELYTIYGTPIIAATGSIKLSVNYATQFVGSGETSNVNLQRILADLGTKLGIRATSVFVEELPTVGNADTFYVIHNDLSDPNKANIYIWNSVTEHYIWVGDNTLDLGDYYTKQEGQAFETQIDNRVTSVENELSSVASGSPKGVYATLAALQSAYPIGAEGIYIVQADGHWYYWNGSAWTDGGVYLSTSDAITSEALDLFTVKKNCPWIKEIYINEIGKARDISAVWNTFPNPSSSSPWINFANSAGNAITGHAMNVNNNREKIVPIYDTSFKYVCGYIVIDWEKYPSENTNPTTQLLYSAFDKNYSPTISQVIENQRLFIENVNNQVNGGKKGTELNGLSSMPIYVSSTSAIWFPLYKWVRKINRIDYLAYTGTVYFHKITINEDKTITTQQIASETNESHELGSIKTIFVDVELEENEYIGINGAFYYDGIERNYLCSSFSVGTNTLETPVQQTMYFNCYYDKNILTRLDELEDFANYKDRVVLINKKMAQQDNDFIGTQVYNDGLVVGNDLIYLNKYYSVEEREIRYVVRFASGSWVSFETITINADNSIGVNSSFRIDPNNKSIMLIPSSYGGVIYCPLLNTTDKFIVAIKKNYLKYEVRITNLTTGYIWKHEYERNGTGGVGDGAIGTAIDVPSQWDYYGFRTFTGNMAIEQIVITAPKCDVLVYGDSVTEPEGYFPKNQFPYSWTQLFRKMKGNKVVTSGRGGTRIEEIMLRIVNELPYIKPKYCMVTIGTNAAPSYSQWTDLVQYIKSLGIIPIINHIPCYNNNGNTTGFIAINQTIDQIRQAENVNGCDFDKATSTNNDGQTLDETTMWLEAYGADAIYRHHPNKKGSARMVARMLIDIPEVFD